jgi:hypothetical protein
MLAFGQAMATVATLARGSGVPMMLRRGKIA